MKSHRNEVLNMSDNMHVSEMRVFCTDRRISAFLLRFDSLLKSV